MVITVSNCEVSKCWQASTKAGARNFKRHFLNPSGFVLRYVAPSSCKSITAASAALAKRNQLSGSIISNRGKEMDAGSGFKKTGRWLTAPQVMIAIKQPGGRC